MHALQKQLPAVIQRGEAWQFEHALLSSYAEILASLVLHYKKPVIAVLPNDKELEIVASLCHFIAPTIEALRLPAWDTLPYDRVSPSAQILSQRVATLSSLSLEKRPLILLTTVNAASQYLPPPATFRNNHFTITSNSTLNRDALLKFLSAQGYQRVGKVMEAGEYAIRGSIIDIFPSGAENAVRIDLFGDEVESLKYFDPLTQISDTICTKLELLPLGEVQLSETTIEHFRSGYRELFGAVTREDPLYESISQGRMTAGMEHWLPLFYERLVPLSDYLPDAIWCLHYDTPAIIEERGEAIRDYYAARQLHAKSKDETPYHPIPPERLFIMAESWNSMLAASPTITLTPFAAAGKNTLSLPYGATPLLGKRLFNEACDYVKGLVPPAVIACNSQGSLERIDKMLTEHGIITQRIEHFSDVGTGIHLAIIPIEHGYSTPHYHLLSEEDLLGERIIRTQKKRKKSEAFLLEAAAFEVGELIVHKEHGIGRFEGLFTVEVNGKKQDCLKLTYDGGDRLFLPVENIDLVSRFGDGEGVALDKLGGVAWQKRKSGLKKRLRMAAEALLKIAADRVTKTAPAFEPDIGSYDEFCARFPYTETEDQLQSIDEVREDLRKGSPMDRLICGDVGFGKTEVALRAAFITASNKQQVALIAPTTLLARQHFKTFSERFRDLPFTIRQLSRMVSAKDMAETKAMLKEGKVDIVIGTHALLGSEIGFKELGLMIVDEEQHFGVKQKERLKEFRTDVHVLTLSATPIPRTLQMSLAGVRELSLITTPPVDRLAVRTYVMPFDPVVTREALLREYHRGGKSFVVTPRVKYMAELKQKLETLVPEIKFAAAHGQMTPAQLDTVMNEFYDGKYDVLLSTAIIESGIDIPTANTMIIDRAEMFGLAQLYQLRGRVGRSKTRAYAYFTLPHQKTLTRDATRRLEVMQQLDSLGAGFQLASHDMDIRGYGNLLGEEQSGHIREVGIELYQAMLEEAISDLKARRKIGDVEERDWSPQINLGMSVLIPENYVEDLSLRLSLYRRVSGLKTHEEIEGFAAEMIDRFGPLPVEVEHLFGVLRIKQFCVVANIDRIDAGPKGAIIAFHKNQFPAPEKLLLHINKHPTRYKLRPDQKIALIADFSKEGSAMAGITEAVKEIAALGQTSTEKAA
ncbi:MAG: transcription-repair coupling factor [Rickettsiales bacterium]